MNVLVVVPLYKTISIETLLAQNRKSIVTILFIIILLAWYVLASLVCAQGPLLLKSPWEMLGPGDADQVTSISVMNDGSVYLGTDVGGMYRSANYGETWEHRNNGLRNYDITTQVVESKKSLGTLLVGTRGGLYKSTDGGNNWRNIRNGLPKVDRYNLSGSIGALVNDRLNPSTLYLGLGYRPSAQGTETVRKIKWEGAIYKSTDDGESWTLLSKIGDKEKINQILPLNNLVYTATSNGLYKSLDGGKSHRKIFDKQVLNIVQQGNDDKIIISAADRGVFSSEDGGNSWQAHGTGLQFKPHPSGPDRYSVLAINARNGADSIIYVANSTWSSSGGVYKIENQSRSWKKITSLLPESWLKTSTRFNAVAVDPTRNKIYIGSSRYVYRSDDGGNNWIQLISKKVDGGGWTHRGLNVFGQARSVAVHPINRNVILIGTTDHGLVKSTDGGISWGAVQRGMKYKDSVSNLVFHEKQPDSIFAINFDTKENTCVIASRNSGESWNTISDSISYTDSKDLKFNMLAISSNNTDKIYVSSNRGIFKTENGGKSWINITNNIANFNNSSNVITINRFDDNILLAAVGNKLYRTLDSGQNWDGIPSGIPSTAAVNFIHLSSDGKVIRFSAYDRALNASALYESKNNGMSWRKQITLKSKISCIAQSLRNPNIFFLTTNDDNYHDESSGYGIYITTDTGVSWVNVSSGLPVLRYYHCVFDNYGRVLLASNGSGAFMASVSNLVEIKEK